jgi:hypothetical protein
LIKLGGFLEERGLNVTFYINLAMTRKDKVKLGSILHGKCAIVLEFHMKVHQYTLEPSLNFV